MTFADLTATKALVAALRRISPNCRHWRGVLCKHMVSTILRTAVVCLMIISSVERAYACSVVIPSNWGQSKFRNMAKDAVDRSTVIIDGEVVQPFVEGKQNAIVRVVRVLKGPPEKLFEIGERDSCSLRLNRTGERRRILLVGGPKVYDLWNDGSNARYEDRYLKSDRRKVWPYVAGQEQLDATPH